MRLHHGTKSRIRQKVVGIQCLPCLRLFSNCPLLHAHLRRTPTCEAWYHNLAANECPDIVAAEVEEDRLWVSKNIKAGKSRYGAARPCGQLPGPLPEGANDAAWTKPRGPKLLYRGG